MDHNPLCTEPGIDPELTPDFAHAPSVAEILARGTRWALRLDVVLLDDTIYLIYPRREGWTLWGAVPADTPLRDVLFLEPPRWLWASRTPLPSEGDALPTEEFDL